jgi:hypothetical protein
MEIENGKPVSPVDQPGNQPAPPPPGRITEKRIIVGGSGASRAHTSQTPPTAITPPPIKRIHLAAKPPGKTRKRQRISGESVIEIGRDIRLVVLSGECEVLWEAPESTIISRVEPCVVT